MPVENSIDDLLSPGIFSRIMRKTSDAIQSAQLNNKIRKLNRTDKHEYQGWLGGVVHKGPYFFASKDGTLIGAYKTFDDAMKALTLEEMLGGGQ
jgi:hypothetical protein